MTGFGSALTVKPTSLPKASTVESGTPIERGWASAVDSIPNAMSFKTAFEKVVKLI